MQQLEQAYVLVQMERRAMRIAEQLRRVPGVVRAEDVSGPYDALALARYDGGGGTIDRIVDAIRDLPGVIRAIAAPLAPSTARAPAADAA